MIDGFDFLAKSIGRILEEYTTNIEWEVTVDRCRWDVIMRVKGTSVVNGKTFVSHTDSDTYSLDKMMIREGKGEPYIEWVAVASVVERAIGRHKEIVFGGMLYRDTDKFLELCTKIAKETAELVDGENT